MTPFNNSPEVSILRSVDRHRRFLVLIRCGSDERPCLFSGPLPDDRNFDVAVNYFSQPNENDFFFQGAELLLAGGLSKYHAAKHFLYAGFLDKYEGILFLDDDVDLHFDPSHFFDFCAGKELSIAQPSLTHASDGAWRITLNHPGFEYRLTNFVEVMAPYLSRDFIMTVVDAFDISISTYGLDVFWGSQLEADQHAAIVDRFTMSHLKRRNLTGGAYSLLQSLGINCFEESKHVLTSSRHRRLRHQIQRWRANCRSVSVA